MKGGVKTENPRGASHQPSLSNEFPTPKVRVRFFLQLGPKGNEVTLCFIEESGDPNLVPQGFPTATTRRRNRELILIIPQALITQLSLS